MKMKLLTIFIICLSPIFCLAKGPGNGPGGGRHQAEAGVAVLEQFLTMNDAQLEQLEATIRRIRQMTPEEREDYRQKISRYQRLPSEERQHIRQAWGKLDKDVRSAWRRYMMEADESEREAVRKELHSQPPESRTEWRIEFLREKGLLE